MKYAESGAEVLRKAQDQAAARRQQLETGQVRLVPETSPHIPPQQSQEPPKTDKGGG
jgi:hypothetical protein